MNPTRLTALRLLALASVLFQSLAFAVEHPNPDVPETHASTEAPKTEPISFGPGDKGGAGDFDEKNGVSLEPGKSLPILEIQVGGEISVSDNNIVAKPWSSTSFDSKGKVQLVQYVAANRAAARQNKPFTDSLIEKRFTSDKLDTTVIVNLADTMEFLQGLVVKKVARNKEKYQTITFVVDDEGLGLQHWGMKNKSCAIIVLDASGKLLFAKDGPLSEIEIENTIKLIEKQIS